MPGIEPSDDRSRDTTRKTLLRSSCGSTSKFIDTGNRTQISTTPVKIQWYHSISIFFKIRPSQKWRSSRSSQLTVTWFYARDQCKMMIAIYWWQNLDPQLAVAGSIPTSPLDFDWICWYLFTIGFCIGFVDFLDSAAIWMWIHNWIWVGSCEWYPGSGHHSVQFPAS